jgi:serine/threonine protein phosphatase 1
MAGRTFAIGDVHGDLVHLRKLLTVLPAIDAEDTIVFLGDYVDRGPMSAQVVEFIRSDLGTVVPARVVALRGNHEDAWLRVVRETWDGFVLPRGNGAFECYRSFAGRPLPTGEEQPTREEFEAIRTGSFLPLHVVEWMNGLPHWYEDDHAIYVHAGVPARDGRFLHPQEVDDKAVLLWIRTREFFEHYRGKRMVVGHTVTGTLPPHLSTYTPADPNDLWAGEDVIAIDTGCGKGGFLTAVELPSLAVYESR